MVVDSLVAPSLAWVELSISKEVGPRLLP